MDFRFSQDELDLAQGTRDFLAGACPPERLREATNAIWDQIAEMGLIGVMAPEDHGGLGLDDTAFVLIAEEAGRAALPEPLVEVAGVALPALVAAGHDVSELVAGRKMALPVSDMNVGIHHAPDTDLLVFARPDGLYAAQWSEAVLSAQASIDPNRHLFAAEFTPGSNHKIGDAALAADMDARGVLFTAAQLLGLTDAMITMATDYAKDREQFGQPIGKFQAIKHHLATALVKLEFARPVVYRAAASFNDPRRDLYIAHAKQAARDAAMVAAETAIQVHGGMGYTFEVDLHYFMKRAWALAGAWGDEARTLTTIDQAVLGGKVPLGPWETFAT
mgnify:CR=1 FL=1